MLENDFLRDSEREFCWQWNSLPCQQISCHSSSTKYKCEQSSISDGGSVTWYEPPPVMTASSSGVDQNPAEIELFEGHPASLSWNFSLTSVNLFVVNIRFNTEAIAFSGPGGSSAKVVDAFKDKFNFTWISQRLTLVIFNVTAEYGESKGNFRCELSTADGPWVRTIQVKIVGKGNYSLT